MVHRILGERPPPEVIRGSGLRCTWLVQTFSHLLEDADEGTILRYAKAYLLYLIGVVLFADKTNNQIHLLYLTLLDDPWERIAEYSWGSAALGYLYRRLCGAAHNNIKEIAGRVVILQFLWDPYLVEAYTAVSEHSRIHSCA
ncbi:serine/threonine-protein phosphatase 7 long form homolog [Amaranthus tricolor]|uniref:serine/threonine-protein phosphatase 7 long form homolog n=1 Tax=Amaranthus tricolor TaxID=29722 RepID=UPI002588FCD8|nr:serine/threonine-protein phosphatase 7 long form homolog [Amaranthus tricolor]